jgi:hypothetical protein
MPWAFRINQLYLPKPKPPEFTGGQPLSAPSDRISFAVMEEILEYGAGDLVSASVRRKTITSMSISVFSLKNH